MCVVKCQFVESRSADYVEERAMEVPESENGSKEQLFKRSTSMLRTGFISLFPS
jgi:hypothetical protein